MLIDARYSRRVLSQFPKADVTVVNSFWLPVFAAPFRKRSDTSLIYAMHRFPKKHFKLYRNLDRVIAVSTAVQTALAAEAPSLVPRTRVVPNAINTDAFRFTDDPTGDAGERPVVLYTGRIHPEKGLHLLAEACGRLATGNERPPLLRLIGVSDVSGGGGGESYLNRLRSLVASPSDLELLPQILNREALAATLRKCDVYCYPSVADRGESFGVAPLEAMAVGCPTIVSALDCFREFVKPGANAMVFDHRGEEPVSELTAALEGLLSDGPRARRIGRAASETAKSFDKAVIAARYLTVFEEAWREKQSG